MIAILGSVSKYLVRLSRKSEAWISLLDRSAEDSSVVRVNVRLAVEPKWTLLEVNYLWPKAVSFSALKYFPGGGISEGPSYFCLNKNSSMLEASGDGSNASSFARSNTFLAILAFFSMPFLGALAAKSLAFSKI